jgi:hypothetical protein
MLATFRKQSEPSPKSSIKKLVILHPRLCETKLRRRRGGMRATAVRKVCLIITQTVLSPLITHFASQSSIDILNLPSQRAKTGRICAVAVK